MGFLSCATEWVAKRQGRWPVKSRLIPCSIIMIVLPMTTPRSLAVTLGAFRGEPTGWPMRSSWPTRQSTRPPHATRSRRAWGQPSSPCRPWGSRFSIAHVGDSRIYLIREAGIQQLTNDHSLVMEQVRRGLMTPEEAEHSKMQNVIVRALGTEESVEPDLADHEFRMRRRIVAVQRRSIAVRRGKHIVEVVGRAPSLEKACTELIELAKTGASDDNITCLLVRTTEQPWRQRLVDGLRGSGSHNARQSSS